ncbi:heterokaryon incompatibility protein-domain-containing protein [Xylaria palmicola]|nr:heterokaryon incompatibility protein-domain-containing protein [Xylaria palmicola]
MVHYEPLDTNQNEIRVLHLRMAASSSHSAAGKIECTLERVSLDHYSDEYRQFLELDGSKKSPLHRDMLWDMVTNPSTFTAQARKAMQPGTLLGDALAGFSDSPVYQQNTYRHATTYAWGDFFALSYEWGDQHDADEIIVDGEKTTVTRNLKDALERLCTWWRRWDGNDSIRLWVDALCINQANIPERNDQVRRMRQIYSTAIKVLIMTGPDVEDPRATRALLDRVFGAIRSGDVSPEDVRGLLGGENCAGWKGVCEIAGRSYWRRLWIIQEVLLANTGAWLCYGGGYCLASVFFQALALLVRNVHHAKLTLAAASGGASEDWLPNVGRMESFIYLDELKHEGLGYPNLMALLDTARKARQSDPRDKVYGLLGMIDDRIHVMPDYHLSLLNVYRDFTLGIIRATGSLSVIYQRASSRKTIPSSWPSWVPDWSAPTMNDDSESIAAVAYVDVRAAGESLHTYRSSDAPDQLICEGFVVDTVDQLACTGVLTEDHDTHDTSSQSLEHGPAHAYEDSAAVRRALWDSLTINQSESQGEAGMAYLLNLPYLDNRAATTSFLHVIDRFQRCNRNLVVAGKHLVEHLPPWSEGYSQLPEDPEIVGMLVYLMTRMIHRRFMVTGKGRVGMAPRTAQLGDSIFILKGCNAPLILRPAGNGTYSVIGECCVDGVMHGEAMRDLEAGRYQLDTVVIC